MDKLKINIGTCVLPLNTSYSYDLPWNQTEILTWFSTMIIFLHSRWFLGSKSCMDLDFSGFSIAVSLVGLVIPFFSIRLWSAWVVFLARSESDQPDPDLFTNLIYVVRVVSDTMYRGRSGICAMPCSIAFPCRVWSNCTVEPILALSNSSPIRLLVVAMPCRPMPGLCARLVSGPIDARANPVPDSGIQSDSGPSNPLSGKKIIGNHTSVTSSRKHVRYNSCIWYCTWNARQKLRF